MKKLTNILVVLTAAFTLASCSSTVPLFVTTNQVGDKKGVSSNTCLFTYGGSSVQGQSSTVSPANGKLTSAGMCFNSEEYGIREAASRAGIDKIATVDLKRTWFFFWTEYELIVTGTGE